ncbi:MAG: hypothetical protein M1826_002626 [Phylliscum demangeonii]|nr:MAG: hypothetical protein M1826_002626 [Phylliscum demangeonii]
MKRLSPLSVCRLLVPATLALLTTSILGAPLKTSSSLSSSPSSSLISFSLHPPAPAPAPTRRRARNPLYNSLSEDDYYDLIDPQLQLGIVVSADDVRRLRRIEDVYDQFLRRPPGWRGAWHAALRWVREQTWRFQHPQRSTTLAEIDRSFVYCLKSYLSDNYFSPGDRLPLWPDSINACDGMLHPSPELRSMMDEAFRTEKQSVVVASPHATSSPPGIPVRDYP